MKREIEAKITGKVQMVMFRDFVKRKASFLNLTGAVENREDGSVRVVAQGEEEELHKLIEYLHKGPFLARVARVEAKWYSPRENFSEFKIVF